MIKYRADIDGLRAVAVLAVVLFHAFPKTLEGGFVGVDIFFVISGFLISTIIFEGLRDQRFSIIDFYSRRIRRIFPALGMVLAVCYAVGAFVLFPNEYNQLGKHIAGGAGFVANLLLWNESGYFDVAADTKPLLHLWSLGIEEQFYLVWPVMLIVFWKWRSTAVGWVIALVAALSFIANVALIGYDAVATFYAPYTRFWELLAGSALAYTHLFSAARHARYKEQLAAWLHAHVRPLRRVSAVDMESALGMALIVLGIRLLDKAALFPGWLALLPVIGAVLVIDAGQGAWLNRRILSQRAMVWVGLISFPLYLWHWPLLSFLRIIEGGVPSVGLRAAMVVLAVLLAWATYRFIERPIRYGVHLRAKTWGLAGVMLAVGLLGLLRYYDIPARHASQQVASYVASIATSTRHKECFEIPHAYDTNGEWFCTLGNADKPPRAFAYGDSHALSLIPALEKLGHKVGGSIVFTGGSGCPPLLGIQSMRGAAWNATYDCKKLNARIFEYVKAHKIPAVILSARWSYYTTGASRPEEFNPVAVDEAAKVSQAASQEALAHGLRTTIAAYHAIGVRVYLVLDNPQQQRDPKDALRRVMMHATAVDMDTAINAFAVTPHEHQAHQALAIAAMQPAMHGATAIALDSALCDAALCPLVKDGRFLYSDDDHLSIDGSLRVYPLLLESFLAH